jgi:hypothetical protein
LDHNLDGKKLQEEFGAPSRRLIEKNAHHKSPYDFTPTYKILPKLQILQLGKPQSPVNGVIKREGWVLDERARMWLRHSIKVFSR